MWNYCSKKPEEVAGERRRAGPGAERVNLVLVSQGLTAADARIMGIAYYDSVEAAQAKMCGLKARVYKPDHKQHLVYNALFKLYRQLHDAFGHDEDRNYFLTYCPMANGNKGAYWLQTVDTVYNSFYGAAMLRCGEIKKPLAAHDEER